MSFSWKTGLGGGGGGSSSSLTLPIQPYTQVPDLNTLATRAYSPREEVVVLDVGDGTGVAHWMKRILPGVSLSSWIDLGPVGVSAPPLVATGWPDGALLSWPGGADVTW